MPCEVDSDSQVSERNVCLTSTVTIFFYMYLEGGWEQPKLKLNLLLKDTYSVQRNKDQ